MEERVNRNRQVHHDVGAFVCVPKTGNRISKGFTDIIAFLFCLTDENSGHSGCDNGFSVCYWTGYGRLVGIYLW